MKLLISIIALSTSVCISTSDALGQSANPLALQHFQTAMDTSAIQLKIDSIGDIPAAIKELTAAIDLDGEFFQAYYYRGLLYSYQSEYSKSELDIDRVLQLNPQHIDALFLMANLCAIREDDDCTLTMFQRIIQINSSNARAFQERGEYLLTHKRLDEGCVDLMRAKELGFEVPDNYWAEIYCK